MNDVRLSHRLVPGDPEPDRLALEPCPAPYRHEIIVGRDPEIAWMHPINLTLKALAYWASWTRGRSFGIGGGSRGSDGRDFGG